MKTEQINGWFLTFKDDEEQLIREALTELGYTADVEGVKEYLLDSLSEEEDEPLGTGATERVMGNIIGFAVQNPDKIKGMAQAGMSMFQQAMKKRAGRN